MKPITIAPKAKPFTKTLALTAVPPDTHIGELFSNSGRTPSSFAPEKLLFLAARRPGERLLQPIIAPEQLAILRDEARCTEDAPGLGFRRLILKTLLDHRVFGA